MLLTLFTHPMSHSVTNPPDLGFTRWGLQSRKGFGYYELSSTMRTQRLLDKPVTPFGRGNGIFPASAS